MAGFEGMNFGSFEEAPGHFDKFYAYVEDPQSIRAFSEEFSQELSVVDREQGFYEIMPKGISKATGMQFLAQKLGIPWRILWQWATAAMISQCWNALIQASPWEME